MSAWTCAGGTCQDLVTVPEARGGAALLAAAAALSAMRAENQANTEQMSHRLWQLSLGQERCHRCSRYATVAYTLV